MVESFLNLFKLDKIPLLTLNVSKISSTFTRYLSNFDLSNAQIEKISTKIIECEQKISNLLDSISMMNGRSKDIAIQKVNENENQIGESEKLEESERKIYEMFRSIEIKSVRDLNSVKKLKETMFLESEKEHKIFDFVAKEIDLEKLLKQYSDY